LPRVSTGWRSWPRSLRTYAAAWLAPVGLVILGVDAIVDRAFG
jgi:hypothetical protein